MLRPASMAKNRRGFSSFDIKVTRQAAAEAGEASPLIIRRLAKLDITMEKGIAMLSKEVQDLVDRSRKANEMIKSVDAGMAALRKQNDEMKAKIEEIASQPPTQAPSDGSSPAQPITVYSLSDEDKAALLEVTKGFDDAIESLKDDIPANVEPTPAGGSQGASSGGAPQETASDAQSAAPSDQQPQVADPKGHAQDAQAASQAKPLAGTEAPTPEAPKEPGAA
jgi:hypothetical protein